MRKLAIVAVFFVLLSGCATKVTVQKEIALTENVPFTVESVDNQCAATPPEGDKDAVTLMQEALYAAIAEAELPQGPDGYKIKVFLKEYAPGDALKRWLMPGWGQTKLTVQCVVTDKDGLQAGEIEVSRSIAAGGGYTIGAWHYIFSDVAKALVKEIKGKMG